MNIIGMTEHAVLLIVDAKDGSEYSRDSPTSQSCEILQG